ncbi:hypothetical protein D3C86_1361380 [compost metagenome]
MLPTRGIWPLTAMTNPATVAISSSSLMILSRPSVCCRACRSVVPFTNQPSPSATISGVSSASGNSPAIASSTSSGVTRPCTTPNSLVTITKLPRARRRTPSRLIGSSVSGTTIAGEAAAIASTLTPSSSATSISFARTTPIISSSSPRHTGNRLCGEESNCWRISSTLRLASTQLISPRGVMIPRNEREASDSTPLIM